MVCILIAASRSGMTSVGLNAPGWTPGTASPVWSIAVSSWTNGSSGSTG